MRDKNLQRIIDDINTFLSSVFKNAVFEIIAVEDHTYTFKFVINGNDLNGFITKTEFDAHYIRYMFEWIDSVLKTSWKQCNMEWHEK